MHLPGMTHPASREILDMPLVYQNNEIMNTADSRLSNRDAAYEQIRHLIISGALSPGVPLSERGLSETLGIGRTPVREAIKTLAQDGLLDISPMRGTFVRQISIEDLREIHETRLALEGMAAFLAAQRGPTEQLVACAVSLKKLVGQKETALNVVDAQKLGWEFHEAIFEAARNQRLHGLYRNLRAQSGLALQKVEGYDMQRTRKAIQEHIDIYAAIEAGNPVEAQRLIWEHLNHALQIRLQMLTSISTPHPAHSTR
jgi:DNA-binding GntR family transcriptional regulator